MPLDLPPALRPSLAAPAAIFGAGVSGTGVRALLGQLGIESVVYDQQGVPFDQAAARRHRLVVYSPGFRRTHPWLALAQAAGADCWGELDFASLFWKGSAVAVTGTNGKTTLTELLAHALRAAGADAEPTGNIGRSFCAVTADRAGGSEASVAVCEVSSFQAESLRHFRAAATLWTNFAEDHLERHADMVDYFAAKCALARRSEVLYAGSSVQAFTDREPAAQALLRGALRITWVPTEGQPADGRLAGTVFEGYPQLENFLLAAAWWRASGREEGGLYAAARTFRLGPHRLARVAESAGVTYWNDSKATNFHAVEAALRRFAGPVLLIAGGKSKGGDIDGFVSRIAPRVKEAFLIGETAPALAAGFAARAVPHRRCAGLAEAVGAVAAAARAGDQVLLSPGFASFDLFRSYEDRGRQFEALVRERLATAPSPSLISS
jgi:UDP-N-acetylmuramoylalanine--D-glutamate ligase